MRKSACSGRRLDICLPVIMLLPLTGHHVTGHHVTGNDRSFPFKVGHKTGFINVKVFILAVFKGNNN